MTALFGLRGAALMAYTTFSQTKNDQLKEPMFFGQPVNVARYDQQKYDIFEKLIEKQLSFFWRPEEVDVSRDRIDYQALPEHEKHIFISNLKYQTLLDSIQGRSPNVALLPLISIPELETWVETWAFSETIHSRSYTHIIRNIVNDPSVVFDDIVTNEQIQKRAEGISSYYDELIEMTSYWHLLGEGTHTVNGKTVTVSLRELKKKLYLCLMSVNALEAIRFYVSLASMSLIRPSQKPCCSRAAWYSAFSFRSPCSRASAIAAMISGRRTDFRKSSSSRNFSAPRKVIGIACICYTS